MSTYKIKETYYISNNEYNLIGAIINITIEDLKRALYELLCSKNKKCEKYDIWSSIFFYNKLCILHNEWLGDGEYVYERVVKDIKLNHKKAFDRFESEIEKMTSPQKIYMFNRGMRLDLFYNPSYKYKVKEKKYGKYFKRSRTSKSKRKGHEEN